MDEIPCAGINENTILLGIRIMENNAIQRRRNIGENSILQAEEIKRNAIRRLLGNSETIPYFRPKKNAML